MGAARKSCLNGSAPDTDDSGVLLRVMIASDNLTFRYPFGGKDETWTCEREYGERLLCRTSTRQYALFAPEMVRRIRLLEDLSERLRSRSARVDRSLS